MTDAHVLVVDDEPDIRELVKEILEDEGFEVSVAESAESAKKERRSRRPDLILLDIWMPGTDGITLLKEWSAGDGLDCPVIMISGHGTVETAVEATRLGAYDFIEKPLSIAKLLLTVNRALEAAQLRRENVDFRTEAAPVVEPVGRSAAMQSLREQAQRIADHDAAVLIAGEAGSGKEVFARFIHARGKRANGPFVHASVAGLTGPEGVVELFGAEEGDTVHFGHLERAGGGTLFLEDIADMETGMQGRLLSALQHGTFLRADGVEPVTCNVRVITATSKDLAKAVAAGKFRDDLYYHLNVVPLHLPPLRDHREDIPELLETFVDQLVAREGLPYRRFTVAGQNSLRNYPWPGNIRELRNVVQRLLILGTADEVEAAEVDAAIGNLSASESAIAISGDNFEMPLKIARENFERAYLEHQLKLLGGNVSKVASRIGVERTHLYRKLRALGIDPKQVDGTSK